MLACLTLFSLVYHILFLVPAVNIFFIDTPPPAIYTLSLHDALPIYRVLGPSGSYIAENNSLALAFVMAAPIIWYLRDRKSTRLNSSHLVISYAVFCLKKKKELLHTRTYKNFNQ